MRKAMMGLALACGALAPGLARAMPGMAEEHHDHAAPERLGTVRFQTSCKPAEAARFNRAVALLHSFAYGAAEKAFAEVAAADPGCAMAHWGMAMTHYHQLWDIPVGEGLRAGAEQSALASRIGGGTPREQRYIAALATYFADADTVGPAIRAQRYADAMAGVARADPQDDEAQIFYALALIATAPPTDRTHANQKKAAAILEPIYRRQPQHPGLAHYLIHAYDSAELASKGLAAARAYAKIAPDAPHALHMPSHIFTRLGLWDDSIASNLQARAAARAEGDAGEELHAMDYLVYAYLQRGRTADAAKVAADVGNMKGLRFGLFKVGYAATAMTVRVPIEQHDWAAAAALQPFPGIQPQVAAILYWARALGRARGVPPTSADADIELLRGCVEALRAQGDSYATTQVHALLLEAMGWRSAANNDAAGAIASLRAAADEEETLEKLPVTPGPVVPAREELGELLLQLGRPADALAEFKASLVLAPGRRGALIGGIAAAEKVGDRKAAEAFRAALR